MNRRVHWIGDLCALLALLGAGAVLLQLAYAAPRTATFAIDAPPVILPSDGFNELEQFADRPGLFRWTRGSGQLQLPNPGGVPALALELAGGTARTVLTQVRLGAVTLPVAVRPEPRTYRLLVSANSGERVKLALDSPTVRAGNRDLGVVVSDVGVAGGGAAPRQALLILAVATAAAYVLLRQAGSGWWSIGGVLALQSLVAVWQAFGGWRYAVFGSILLLASAAALGGVMIERWLLPGRWIVRKQPAAVLPARPAWTWREVGVVAGLLLAALLIRLPWLIVADPVGDLELSARRLGHLYNLGLAGAYIYNGDYMPIRLYVLRGMSELVLPLGGVFRASPPTATLALIKLPGLFCDLATVPLVYLWSRRWRSIRGAALMAALYTLAPPVWINVAWWGQVDAFLMLPMLLAIMLLDRAGGRWSWLWWTVALLVKPQAIILAPLLYLATLRRHGTRGLLQGGVITISLFVLACVPLVLAGQGPGLMQAYLGSVGRFPKLTNGAWNLWYLVTGGVDTLDMGQGIGPVSFNALGFGLLGVVALLAGLAVLQRADGPLRAAGAAVLALAFFLLPTEIHERYAFLPLAFLALWLAGDNRILVPYLVLVATATLNVVGELRGFAPGAYTYLATSPWPLVLSAVNLLVFVYLIVHLLRSAFQPAAAQQSRSWLRSLNRARPDRANHRV